MNIRRDNELRYRYPIRCSGQPHGTEPEKVFRIYCPLYGRKNIEGQLKSELLTALQPAFAKISEMGVRYSALPGHAMELAEALNDVLSAKWRDARGIEIVVFGVSAVNASEDDEKMIKEIQRNAVFRNPNMAAAHMVGAQAQAMQDAANNSGDMGAMGAFMGMAMAQNLANANAANLFAMGQQQAEQKPAPQGWSCSCGKAGNTGKFCMECGKARPEEMLGWNCSCGMVNKGKFCPECGKPKPAGAPLYKCDKCGWEPEDPKNPPKFCPECGDIFDEDDIGKKE